MQDDSNGSITLSIGGQKVIALIDSGSPINTISEQEWNQMKQNRARLQDINYECEKVIKAYATESPLRILASFVTKVEVAHHNKPHALAKFYVIKGSSQALLSKQTAEEMKLLKVGVEVSALKNSDQIKSSKTEPKFPKVPGLQIKFKIDENVTPKRFPRIRIPVPLQDEVQERLEEMERVGIIEKASENSAWINPLEVVVKGKDDFRIVIDMRKPNEAIQRAHYPLPEMSKFHRQLKGARYFTKLDLKSAFHHIELHPDSRNITTFMTPRGPRRFTRLLFGVNTAPEIFQKEMEKMLLGCKGVIVFIDDILIFGETLEELHKRVSEILKILVSKNLTLNKSKCVYDQEEVQFLGYKIDKNGFKPADDKVAAIREFKQPGSIAELRSFLGLVTHLGQYIADLSTIAEPLRMLTKKGVEWKWETEQVKSFEEIRKRIVEDIQQQGFYHPSLETRLYVDASPVGVGAVLTQIQKKGKEQTVAYASKSLTEVERRYPQNQREALAVVWGVERFSHFLLGKMFTIFTDNKAVEYLFGGKDRDNKRAITRAEGWALRLSSYNFKMKFIGGQENIADPLSRLRNMEYPAFDIGSRNQEFCDLKLQIKSLEFDSREQLNKTSLYVRALNVRIKAISIEKVIEESKVDPEIIAIRRALSTNIWPNEIAAYQAFACDLFEQRDVLIRGDRIVLPKNLRQAALEIVHMSHAGVSTMKRALREKVWWSGLDIDVDKFAKSCKSCAMVARDNPPPPCIELRCQSGHGNILQLIFIHHQKSERKSWSSQITIRDLLFAHRSKPILQHALFKP